jgi:mitochondrial ribonuclease P protein 1
MFSRVIRTWTTLLKYESTGQQRTTRVLPFLIHPHHCHFSSGVATTVVEDREKMLKILLLEASVMRQEGKKVPDPSNIKEQHWDYLLTLKTRSARTKYYVYLWQIEKKQESSSAKKEIRAVELAERRKQLDLENDGKDKYLIYSLMHNSYFLRIYETTMNLWHNNKLSRAMQFGQKLVYDCSYDEHMTQREAIK